MHNLKCYELNFFSQLLILTNYCFETQAVIFSLVTLPGEVRYGQNHPYKEHLGKI